jgi:hypothetical protein
MAFLANHEAMPIRRSHRQFPQSAFTIGWRRDNLRTAGADLREVVIDVLDEQMNEPRVIAGLLCCHLVAALAEHHVEAVERERTPAGGVDVVFCEAEDVEVVLRRSFVRPTAPTNAR